MSVLLVHGLQPIKKSICYIWYSCIYGRSLLDPVVHYSTLPSIRYATAYTSIFLQISVTHTHTQEVVLRNTLAHQHTCLNTHVQEQAFALEDKHAPTGRHKSKHTNKHTWRSTRRHKPSHTQEHTIRNKGTHTHTPTRRSTQKCTHTYTQYGELRHKPAPTFECSHIHTHTHACTHTAFKDLIDLRPSALEF